MKLVSISALCVLAIGAPAWSASKALDTAFRLRFAPEVRKIVESDTPEGVLARVWVRYVQGLTGEAGVRLEDVVTADVHCIELEAAGYPRGIAGLRQFRQQINAAFPDETTTVTRMQFSGPGMIEADLQITGTHRGDLMGHPATGRTVRFVVHALGRFDGDRLVERWDRMDFAGLLQQLGPGTH